MKKEDMHDGVKGEKTYCVFGVGEREFLLLAEDVREVVDIARIFPIPGAPDYVYGALPLRGKIIPAVDLSKIYPIEKPSYAAPKLLIIDVENENIGFLSETAPFFVTFDDDIVVDDLIDIKNFFETYRIKTMGYGKN
ncbi:MAG TPA: chemotaxis protein CheW [Dissulfurispiraceae bacterium]|nr:chemotaxis protein CheW [Dissulfurispiraceae bacterium]